MSYTAIPAPTDQIVIETEAANLAADPNYLVGAAYSDMLETYIPPEQLKQLTISEYKASIDFSGTVFQDGTTILNENDIKSIYPELPPMGFVLPQGGPSGWINVDYAGAENLVPSINQYEFDIAKIGDPFIGTDGGAQTDSVLTPNELTNEILRAMAHAAFLSDVSERIYYTLGVMMSAEGTLGAVGSNILSMHEDNWIADLEYFGGDTNEWTKEYGEQCLLASATIKSRIGFYNQVKDEIALRRNAYSTYLISLVDRRDAYLTGTSAVLLDEQQRLYQEYADENIRRSIELVQATIKHYSEQTIVIIQTMQEEHETAMAAQAVRYEALIADLRALIEEQAQLIRESQDVIANYSNSLDERDALFLQMMQGRTDDIAAQYGLTAEELANIQATDFSSDLNRYADDAILNAQTDLLNAGGFDLSASYSDNKTAYIAGGVATLALLIGGGIALKKRKTTLKASNNSGNDPYIDVEVVQ